ncbi:MAG TPA: hypothetical protein VFD32_09340, partial [Dehalococcoidia bacterium]|nr:hypothetical protein [Dehalococcoidia bacterium]
MIGRERELMDLTSLLGRARLVTLIGPGGIGKTRLALAAAEQEYGRFPHGVYFVDLAPLRDAAQIPGALAQVLGVREVPAQPLTAVLSTALRERCLLIVFDNFEHILGGAGLVEAILTACPLLTVLATSRAVLQLPGEHLYPVPPLSVPAADTASIETLTESPAVALFVARAQAIQPDFALTQHTAVGVAAICRRLDGLPLALELAAARMKIFSPAALLTRLDRCLPVLTGGARTAPERQQTLRATLAWSYDLLGAGEQALFRRLAVFSGGWTLEAAEQVCDVEGSGSVLATLASLVDQSLVERQANPDGAVRFSMLETLREFAAEQLSASGEESALRGRHALAFLALAEAAAPSVATIRVSEAWQARLEQEHDNLRSALASCLAAGDRSDEALRLAAALVSFWHTRGHLSEGRRWLAQALAAGSQAPAASRAWALTGDAVLAGFQSDYAAACAQAEAALALWRELDDAQGIAFTLAHLGFGTTMRGQLAVGRALVEESVAAWRALGGGAGLTMALNMLALATRLQGDYAASAAAAAEELLLAREQQDPLWMAMATRQLGRLAVDQHDGVRAAQLLGESLALFRQQADPWQVAASLLDLTHVALAEGAHARARRCGEEALGLFEQLGMTGGLAASHHALGHAGRLAGDLQRAAGHYAMSMVQFRAAGMERLSVLGRAGLGWTALRLDRTAQAARLLASAPILPRRSEPMLDQVAWPFYADDVAAAETALGTAAFAAAWAEGEALAA